MQSNPLKDKGFIPGDMSQENYDRIDLHRPYVDNIVLVNAAGKPMYRETDLIDVWFDSGSTWKAVLQSNLYKSGGYPASLYLCIIKDHCPFSFQ